MIRTPLRNGSLITTAVGQGSPNSRWTHQRSAALRAVALVFPTFILASQDRFVLPVLLLTLVVCTFWHYLFSRSRQQLPGIDLLATVLLFVLMLPPGYDWGQLLMAISFGVILGEQVFGGRGYSFTHPSIVALAFLLYSFPAASVPHDSLWLTLSLLPGVLLLVVFRLIDYRVILAILSGVIVVVALSGADPMQVRPASVVLVGLLFAVTDPAVGSLTRVGNTVYGLVAGLLVGILDPTLTSVRAMVFACLLASISAPMIDWGVERLYRFNRGRLHA